MDAQPPRDDIRPAAPPAEAGDVDVGPLADPVAEPELAAFLAAARDELCTPPDAFTARRHLAAMRDEVLTQHRARGFGLRVASVAAAAAVAVVVTLGGFGALPAPAQEVLSNVAERVGIELPSPARDIVGQLQIPPKQIPASDTVPGRAGGPDKADLPTPWADADQLPPGLDDHFVPPGLEDGSTPPGLDDGFPPLRLRPDQPGRFWQDQDWPGRDRAGEPDEPSDRGNQGTGRAERDTPVSPPSSSDEAPRPQEEEAPGPPGETPPSGTPEKPETPAGEGAPGAGAGANAP